MSTIITVVLMYLLHENSRISVQIIIKGSTKYSSRHVCTVCMWYLMDIFKSTMSCSVVIDVSEVQIYMYVASQGYIASESGGWGVGEGYIRSHKEKF